MAKKTSPNDAEVRAKAKAMRESQRKADQRTRNIIFVVVGIIVVALIVAIVFAVKSDTVGKAQSGDGGVPAQFAQGEPIVLSHLGVGESDPNLDDLALYTSFTCSYCAILEDAAGTALLEGALNGDYNLVIHPVSASVMPYLYPATNAILRVAADAPDQFPAFFSALYGFTYSSLESGDTSTLSNLRKSTLEVAEIAANVGVPQNVIDQFSDDAQNYLTLSNQAWGAREVKGREGNPGSPEIVFKDTKIEWTRSTEPNVTFDSIIAGMTALGYVPGGSGAAQSAESE